MLLIFGIRAVLDVMGASTYTCERCGQHAQHDVLRQRKKLSLFFIPVLTLGRARFLDECTACGRVLSISEADAEAAARGMAPGPQDSTTWTPQDR